jgi:hypothetical protein
MTKGLALARLFDEAGHDVVGADFGPLACGRMSRSLQKFHRLQKPDAKARAGANPLSASAPYVQNLLDIITREDVDLWVSCSGVASAVEDGMAKEIVEARTRCRAVQFDLQTTRTLHEKHSFIEHTYNIGLTVPETHIVTSRAEAEGLLLRHDRPRGRQYIMKTIGMDDSVRGDMTLLPKSNNDGNRPSVKETTKHLSQLEISRESPWILQQFISGKEYCTHSLVVRGEVQAFVACPSAELLMHYEALPADSSLSRAMLDFTKRYAAHGEPTFTGHLSFDLMVEQGAGDRRTVSKKVPGDLDGDEDAGDVVLHPIECNPRAHTAVALFAGTTDMVDGYLSVLDGTKEAKSTETVVTPLQKSKYYWVGHDLVTLVILPSFSLLTSVVDLTMSPSSLAELVRNHTTFVDHVTSWKDGTYEAWDPLPWWWLYHVYWPMQFLQCMWAGKKWSRINVSTTKMFEC